MQYVLLTHLLFGSISILIVYLYSAVSFDTGIRQCLSNDFKPDFIMLSCYWLFGANKTRKSEVWRVRHKEVKNGYVEYGKIEHYRAL